MTNETVERDLDDRIEADETQGRWIEKYRPRSIDNLILPPRIEQRLRQLIASQDVPNVLLIGPPGIGKTSAAKIIGETVDPENHIRISGATGRGGQVSSILDFASTVSLTGGRKLIIADDADLFSIDSQRTLCSVMDDSGMNCGYVLVGSSAKKFIPALQSRCAELDLTPQPDEKEELLNRYLKRTSQILQRENIPFEEEVIEAIISTYYPDFRRILNEVQAWSSV